MPKVEIGTAKIMTAANLNKGNIKVNTAAVFDANTGSNVRNTSHE